MGSIVGAYAMSHVLGTPEGLAEPSERVFQGMREIGARLRAARPDLIIVLTSDHLNNFEIKRPMPLAIGVAETYAPYGDMGLPTTPFRGNATVAQGLLHAAQAAGIDLQPVSDVKPDHGMMIPLGIVDPDHAIRAFPLYINTVCNPAPTPDACWRLGTVLRHYVEQTLPRDFRVALLAGGGLSHWLGVPEEGRVNEAWDRWFMDVLNRGDGAALSRLDNPSILRDGGNGGLEVNAWIALAGAVPGARGETIFYEAIPAWASGMAGVTLDPATAG
jgi:2'-aminobiphenyl-2,3-diol 1,2-dioxygenase, large subunit